jgi:hypothetical protein
MSESLVDSVLGSLVWNDRLQWWVGEVHLSPNHRVEMFISPENGLPDEPEELFSWVRAALGRIRSKDRDYRGWTASQVIDTRWNLEEPMTVEEITDLLGLASIDFHPDGSAGLYWNDQDRLYGGHNLITELDKDGKCIEVRMEG